MGKEQQGSLTGLRVCPNTKQTQHCTVVSRYEALFYKLGRLYEVRRSDVKRWLDISRSASEDR